jgi:hypothetical protein
MRERDIEDYLVKRVNAMGGEVRKVKWIGRRGAPDRLVMLPIRRVERDRGTSYIIGTVPSATVWVELKAPGEKPKPHQAREHERMRKMGQRVEVIDSLEGVEELLS